MVNDPGLFEILDGTISEEDFSDEECTAVAQVLFKQYRETGSVRPASVVDMFDDVDKQRMVATMLQTELPFETSSEERERALNDVVKKVKLDRIDRDLNANSNDMAKFQALIMEKAKLSKMHISLNNG